MFATVTIINLGFSNLNTFKERINWIDQARGFAILMVVYGHNFPYLEKYIYTFHVPLFFLVAGFFHPKKNSLINVKTRFKQLIIPYFIWAFLLYFTWVFVTRFYGDSANLSLSPLKNLIGVFYAQGGREYMDWGIPLWFLPCIFLVFSIFFFIQKIGPKLLKTTILFSLICIGFLISHYFNFKYFWSFDVALVALCFYGIGYFFKNKLLNLNKRETLLLLFIALIFHLTLYFFNIKVDMYRSVYGNQFVFITSGIFGSLFWLMFFKSFPVFDFLSYLGKNTIILLCSHTRVLTFIKLIILIVGGSAVFNFNEFTKIGLTVLQIILMIPIIYLVNKYLPLLNGKIKKD